MNTHNILCGPCHIVPELQDLSTHPVRPSTVSSMGSTWILLPYLTSGHGCTDTTSDKRTRKLFLTTRFIRIFSSGQVSSDSTIQTVSFLRLPFSSTVSPRNSCSSSILCWTETSEWAAVTLRHYDLFIFSTHTRTYLWQGHNWVVIINCLFNKKPVRTILLAQNSSCQIIRTVKWVKV